MDARTREHNHPQPPFHTDGRESDTDSDTDTDRGTDRGTNAEKHHTQPQLPPDAQRQRERERERSQREREKRRTGGK
eukprot:714784-Pleurochrysis_carterae.AAC.1